MIGADGEITRIEEVQEKPSLPQRLESIEQLLNQAHNQANRMLPRPGIESEEKAPAPAIIGLEEQSAIIERKAEDLRQRIGNIADVVGRL